MANRTSVNLAIDLTAGLLFLMMVATGFVVWFAMPPGTNKSLSLMGLSRHQWGSVHGWFGVGLIACVLVHVALHWQWIVSVLRRRFGRSNPTTWQLLSSGALSMVSVAGLFALAAWSATSQVQRRETTDSATVCPTESIQRDAAAPEVGSTPRLTNGEGLEFWRDVYPVLESSCLACHGPTRQRAGFRVDQREGLFGSGRSTPWIVPGQSDRSPLIDVMSGARPEMSFPDRHRLPERDVAVLRAWIDEGAVWREPPEAEE